MNRNSKQRKHTIVEESEEDSEWEGGSYEGNSEPEYDDELEKDSWDDDTLMNNVQRTTTSKKKGHTEVGDKHTTSNVHNRSKGRKKAKVASVLERSLVSKSQNNARDTNLDVVERTKVYSRSPDKRTKHHKGHPPQHPTKPIRDKGKDITPTTGQQSRKNQGLPDIRKASGNVNKQYKSPAPLVAVTPTVQDTSLATSLPANTSISPLPRVNRPNVAPCNRQLVRPTGPNFNLITSPGLLSESQNLQERQNSEIPLIETDFSQPPDSLDIDGALNTTTDGIIEQTLTEKKKLNLGRRQL